MSTSSSHPVPEQDLQTYVTEPSNGALPLGPEPNGSKSTEADAPAGTMIVFEGVTKVYDPQVLALNDVSFAIDKGE
ncbi:MAG: hypothetical protein H0U07_00625, partial [Actinobacteria bacterium]|nr:hypothetical protein [Actinomycetota bacterium]